MPTIPRTSLAAVLTAAVGLTTTACLPDALLITPVRTNRKLVESEIVHEAWLAPKIAVIDVTGVLVNARRPGLLSDGEQPVSLLLEQLDRARRDGAVKAVILRINSPGGTVGAGELMHHEVMRFREETGKPVIAVMMDVAASGAYYVACACDELVAHRSTVTGSIGVILQLFDVTGAMAKIGVTPNTIKSGPLKAIGSPFQRLSDQDREVFQGVIDGMYEEFVAVVVAGRPNLTEARIRELADGRVYTAAQALDVGLIDRIGTLQEVIASTKQRVGVKHANVVAYHRPNGYVANYYARGGRPAEVNAIKIELPSWLRDRTPRFMYLWSP